MISALDKKLLRDLRRLWAQSLAVALVMACGVSTIIISVGAYRSLEETQRAFYDRYRFATVFASVVRAPRYLEREIKEISDVSSIELRIVKPVLLSVLGQTEPASGIAISIPDTRPLRVNKLYLRKGRLPEPARRNEVAVIETFARAHNFEIGDGFDVIMGGRRLSLTIVGTVLSPEHIYSIGPGDMVPDEKRYGIFFMSQKALSALFDLESAFNDVNLITLRDANLDNVVERLNRILAPYGGTGAYTREEQTSHAFLDSEFTQLSAMAKIIPPIFLGVAAYLVNMILSRLVALEREQVGLLKAIGYSNFAIGWHYSKLIIVIALVGIVIGSGFGLWVGRGLTRLYATFFSFPFLIFKQSLDLFAIAGGLTIGAALAGGAKAIYSIVVLPPAVAMRPPAPANYRNFLIGQLQRLGLFSQLSIMALRHLVRRPIRAAMTTVGISMSVALLITSLFSYDAIDSMVDTIFFRADRQDATILLAADAAPRAIYSIKKLPGILRAEPFRQTPIILTHENRSKRMALFGLPKSTELSRILDPQMEPYRLPTNGIILSEYLAETMQLNVGDTARITLLDKERREVALPVIGLSQGLVGLSAYTSLEGLNRLLRDGPRISGAHVTLDGADLVLIYREIKNTPEIAGVALRDLSRIQFQNTIEQNIYTQTTIFVLLAVIIAFGVVYNSARIQLSERARELASLRVFGFTRPEVSSVLMLELAILVFAAQPIGWVLGYGFSWSVTQGFSSDLFRIPLLINSDTYAYASLVVFASALISALVVRRRIDRLDLISVLKTRE
ncbi:ABC transporter permease [Pseudahrensia aquimaris]|uniref:ABC transporter permease n=1 Tax=Pseudahrensia aquimaris TaxID=744461 RepID=A0ABW3F8P2_9HYPH